MKNYIHTILLVILITSCSKEKDEEVEINEIPLEITQEYLNENGILQGFPVLKQVADEIKVKGKVDVPPNARVVITAKTDGFVRQIYGLEGASVSSGQSLAIIENPELITMQKNLKELQAQLTFAKQELSRKQKLYTNEATSLKALQEAKSNVNILQTSINGTQKELAILGSNSSYGSQINISSTINGKITNIMVKKGDYILKQMPIMEILNENEKHIVLEIPAQYASKVIVNLPMSIDINNKKLKGKIIQVSPEINNETRTITAHCHLSDHHLEYLLKVNEIVNATLFFSYKMVYTLPKDAIISEGEKYFVVQIKNKQINRIEVQGKIQGNDFILQNNSLSKTKLVTKNMYYLN